MPLWPWPTLFQYKLGDKATEELIAYLAGLGMKGLEVYHSSHNRLESAKLQEMAARHHLLSTGGSDFTAAINQIFHRDRAGRSAGLLLLLDAIKTPFNPCIL